MLLGQALIQAGVLSEADLQQALETQASSGHVSLGAIISQLFGVPREVVESHYLNLAIIPCIKEWLQKQLSRKAFSDGLSAGNIIADISVQVTSFTRYEAETVSFQRQDDGMYREIKSLTRMEKIIATLEPLVITTTKQQEIIFHNVHLEVSLRDKGVRPDNPGFLPEVRLRLLKAFKEKD